MVNVHLITDISQISASPPDDINVVIPTKPQDLFLILHELGHLHYLRRKENVLLLVLRQDYFSILCGCPASSAVWEHELEAWEYTFNCVAPKYWTQLLDTAEWALSSYYRTMCFKALEAAVPNAVRKILCNLLKEKGHEINLLKEEQSVYF